MREVYPADESVAAREFVHGKSEEAGLMNTRAIEQQELSERPRVR